MGFYSGNTGSIDFKISGQTDFRPTQTKVTNWTLSTSAQVLNTTTLGDYDKNSVYGLRTTSGTLKLFYYTSDGATHSNNNNNSASYLIRCLVRTPSDPTIQPFVMRLRLYIDDKNKIGDLNNRDYIEFDALLTSVSYGSNVGELVSVDISIEAVGPILANQL